MAAWRGFRSQSMALRWLSGRSYIADILTKVSTWPNQRIDDLLPYGWRALAEQAAE
jgi:hypothetical protein